MSHIFPVVIHSLAWENRISSTEERRHVARLRAQLHTLSQMHTFKKNEHPNEHLR